MGICVCWWDAMKKDVPEAPEIGDDGHGEDDDAFDWDGNVVDVARERESRGDEK